MPQQSIQSSVSPLRQRMLEDMAMRGLREETQRDYIRFVRSFAAFLRRSPDTATAEDVRRFQVHQSESGMQPPSINSSVSALRFFFAVTLDRPDLSRRRVAGVGGHGAQSLRRRQYPHADPPATTSSSGRTGQRPQGPQRDAVAAAARSAAALVAGGQTADRHVAARLAVPWSQSCRTAVDPSAQPRRPRGSRSGRDQEARDAAHAAPQLCPLRSIPRASHAEPFAAPPTSWNRMSTSASSRCCSGIPSSTRLRFMPVWRPRRSGR